jgi:hypothetical protein
MAEYIDRDAAKRRLVLDYAYAAAKLLDEVDAADVVPMDFHERCLEIEIQKRLAIEPKRGRWEFDGSDFADIWKCSACGEDWYF